jgi:hypothetical protein
MLPYAFVERRLSYALRGSPPYQYDGKPVVGDWQGKNIGQCAQLAQQTWAHQYKRDMPTTAFWRPGRRVMDCKPGELTPGTVLATFDNGGRYHNRHGYHTVLYVRQTLDRNGRPDMLTVIHQHQQIGPTIKHETFRFAPNFYHYKDARNYYVVEPASSGASGSW